VIGWDAYVSRAHIALEPMGEEWLAVDDGLSRNGTWLNGTRLSGRRRLANGDRLRVGATVLTFRPAGPASTVGTLAPPSPPVKISEGQQRVLQALLRPMRESERPTLPATNKEIAEELQVAVATVVDHLKKLSRRLDIAALPQGQRRFALANRALELNLV
jgi:pSer/pThr/pTyr-binding forkhead associated (FHA) protein